MKTLLYVLQLFPAILAAVRSLEDAVPMPQQGKAKLDLVLDVARAAYDASVDLQREFAWDKLAGIVVAVVGKVVGALNALGVFKTSQQSA